EQSTRPLAIPARIARQRGMTIHAAFLERDPVGPQIPLLDDMYSQGAALGDTDGRAMQWSAIAKKDHVADCPVDGQPIEKFRPCFRAPAKIDASRKPPEGPIAAVEIHPVNRMAAPGERLSEPCEKARCHSLQEQKAATGANQRPVHPLRRTYG